MIHLLSVLLKLLYNSWSCKRIKKYINNKMTMNSPVEWLLSDLHKAWTYSWGRLGFKKGSLSAPFTALVLRCFGSEFVVGAWELLEDGGFLLARSFLCLSMSSLCWFIDSCCLQMESRDFGSIWSTTTETAKHYYCNTNGVVMLSST